MGAALADRALPGAAQHGHLRVATHDRNLRERSTGVERIHGDGRPRAHWFALSLGMHRRDRLVADDRAGDPPRLLADEDGPRCGRGLEASRRVHRVADHRLVAPAVGTDRREHHLAGVHADAELEAAELLGVLGGLAPKLQRGTHGALGVVTVRDLGTEHREDPIAHHLVEPAAVAIDDARHPRDAAVHEPSHVLGIGSLRHPCEAGEVGEHDRRPPPLLTRRTGGRRGLLQRRSALTAEAEPDRVGALARGTGELERRAARAAEALGGIARLAAGRTCHVSPAAPHGPLRSTSSHHRGTVTAPRSSS